MNKVSPGNKYFDSEGRAYSQAQINTLIHNAKQEVLEDFLYEFGYLFCVDCKQTGPTDMSHTISIEKAKQMRQVELCWTVTNIQPRCRKCHNKLDLNN